VKARGRLLVSAGAGTWARELAAALLAGGGWQPWPARRPPPRGAYLLRLHLPPPWWGRAWGLGLADPVRAGRRPALLPFRRRLLRGRPLLVPSRHAARLVESRFDIPAEACVVVPPGHEHLFPAAPPASGQVPETRRRVLVVADHPGRGEAMDLVRRALGRTGLVALEILDPTGRPPGERRRLLEEALALVVATWEDPCGLPAVEALAAGCPVVSCDRGAVPEHCGPEALSWDPGDEQGLARHLLRLASDPPWRRELVARGRLRAGRLSWRRSVDLAEQAVAPWLRD